MGAAVRLVWFLGICSPKCKHVLICLLLSFLVPACVTTLKLDSPLSQPYVFGVILPQLCDPCFRSDFRGPCRAVFWHCPDCIAEGMFVRCMGWRTTTCINSGASCWNETEGVPAAAN